MNYEEKLYELLIQLEFLNKILEVIAKNLDIIAEIKESEFKRDA